MIDKTIYIIRHGQTDYNLRGIVQGGGVDTSLNATGRAQAQAFHDKYGHLPFQKILTSDLKRTHETVAPFIEKGLEWEQHPSIREMGWGDQEGKEATPASKIEYDKITKGWEAGNFELAISNGESAAQLRQRLEEFVDHLRNREEELLLICSHGRAMRGLMCVLREESLTRMQQYSHSNTGLWLVEQREHKFHFHVENDTSHLLLREGKQWKSKR